MCTPTEHLKIIDLYCRDCRKSFCVKCLSTHKHHDIIEMDEYLDEIKSDLQEKEKITQESLDYIINERNLIESEYKELVLKHFDSQFELIEKVFRDLHDQLHVKQIEIKREFQSYLDDNNVKYSEHLSLLEDYIKQLNQSLEVIKTGVTVDNSDLLITTVNQYRDTITLPTYTRYNMLELDEESTKKASDSIISIENGWYTFDINNENPLECELFNKFDPELNEDEFSSLKSKIKSELRIGDEWFLLNMEWYEKWKKNTYTRAQLSPIPNNYIEDDEGRKYIDVQENVHYKLVPKEVYNKLVAIYGIDNDKCYSGLVIKYNNREKPCVVVNIPFRVKLIFFKSNQFYDGYAFPLESTLEFKERYCQHFKIKKDFNMYYTNTFGNRVRISEENTIGDLNLQPSQIILFETYSRRQ
ncbi:hypothetical protein DLAC_03159 [Tieghemostelium lacteum]|uniref:DUSP domain-containing protein n=1 Tax=Tieghemostelium lacteum TaxID=361077 RepID=A0A152A2T0_TIELA|nr:hypothetical protein DLAC_03159 [Tieghemostelium lacteum]|eukprot:KYR00407.1 hypothetical protein DLAC_03159 [Tieghemostelium lacteum]